MKVKATVSFVGALCMAKNEVRDVRKDVAAPLLKIGYLVSVKEPSTPEETQKPEETQEPDGGETSNSSPNSEENSPDSSDESSSKSKESSKKE